jgi:hypothetical protein
MDDNRSYFMRRAAEERSAAERATDEAARGAHLEMARRYGKLAAPARQADVSGPAA